MITERTRYALDTPHKFRADATMTGYMQDKQGFQAHREIIGVPVKVDTIVTFDVKGEFGLRDGIGAIFGEALTN